MEKEKLVKQVKELWYYFAQRLERHCLFQARRQRDRRGTPASPPPPPQAAEVNFFVDQRFRRLELGTVPNDHDDLRC